MGQIGTVAIMLLFGMGFALFVGSGGTYGVGFLEMMQYMADYNTEGLVNLIINAVMNPLTLVTIAVITLATFGSGNTLRYTVGVAILVAIASIFISPFSFYNEAMGAIPIYLQYLIKGFFNLLLVLAVIGFVSDKDW